MAGAIRYAKSQGFRIAWQEFGAGERDLALVWGTPNNIESLWDWPTLATLMRGLGRLGRVVHMDQRGTGLSDRVAVDDLPSIDERARDVIAVLDAAHMERVTLLGEMEGARCAVRVATTYPDRVERLVLLAPRLRTLIPEEMHATVLELVEENWGEPLLADFVFPTHSDDPRFRDWLARHWRNSASPADARAMLELDHELDVVPILPEIGVPTLVVGQLDDPMCPTDTLQEWAAEVADSELVLVPGSDSGFGSGPGDREALEAIAAFVGEDDLGQTFTDRKPCAVLFTDIVGSTERAAELGDAEWRRLIDSHDRAMNEIAHSHGADWVKSTGDGMAATFASAEDAVGAALDAHTRLERFAIAIRAGVHFGEVEIRGSDISGLDVHVAARVADRAAAGQVLVSNPAADALGARQKRVPAGSHRLKGVPGEWPLWEILR